MGDPLGIGPEIIVKALAQRGVRDAAKFHVYGIESCLARAADRGGYARDWTTIGVEGSPGAELPARDVVVFDHADLGPGQSQSGTALPGNADTGRKPGVTSRPGPTARGGRASLAFLEGAVAAAKLPRGHPRHATAIVTAPISKTSWNLAGEGRYPGHTELLAARFDAPRVAMMFVGPSLRVVLVTIHVPLRDVPGLLTTRKVEDAIDLGRGGCIRLGIGVPRIAVCGLNPHAGEGGILGTEDDGIIRPAIAGARARGIDARGPFPADTVFLGAATGEYDLVVAMYHDQGLIPIKLLDRDRAVNFTVGLSKTGEGGVIRTSPAHGTAFDIAGKNLARPDSMIAAIELAARVARNDPRTG